MADQWFRIYNTVRHDRKIRKLSDQAFRAWIMLLSLASEENGKIPEDFEDLSMELHLSVGKTREILQSLLSVGLIERLTEKGYIPHKWEERQFKSDTSTPRVKRFRERHRNVSETAPETEQIKTEQNIAAFDRFFEHFPKKERRSEAQAEFFAALSKTNADSLISAARLYAGDFDGDTKFATNPVSWLQNERWKDFPAKKSLTPALDAERERQLNGKAQ